jgi:hypothetical protein
LFCIKIITTAFFDNTHMGIIIIIIIIIIMRVEFSILPESACLYYGPRSKFRLFVPKNT